MAFVYWIKHIKDEDILSQGYVGITSRTVEERLKSHNYGSKKHNIGLYNLIASKEFEVITLCECSIEYASYIENKLRPNHTIGLNLSPGGNIVSMTEEGKKRVSDALKGKPKTEQHRANLSKSRVGFKVPEAHNAKRAERLKGTPFFKTKEEFDKDLERRLNIHPLDYSRVNFTVWADVYELYRLFLSGLNYNKAERKRKLKKGSLKGMWARFNRGYNPLEDQRMINFVESNKTGSTSCL